MGQRGLLFLAILSSLDLSPVLGFTSSLPERRVSALGSILGGDEGEPAEDVIGAPVGPLPSVSSRINYASVEARPTVDLWVAGAGTLGGLAVRGLSASAL